MNRKRRTSPDHAAALAAVGACRQAMIHVLRTVKPMGPVYKAADGVIRAIDAFAGELTGDPEWFWIGGSVGPDRAEEVRARRPRVDR